MFSLFNRLLRTPFSRQTGLYPRWLTPFLILMVSTLPLTAKADLQRVGPLQTELVADVAAIQPGQPFTVALRLVPDEHWHVYWRNPGDAGLPPKITWRLPIGFTASEILWPRPELIDAPPLTSFGYHGDILLPVTITAPADLAAGDNIQLEATAEWLVCKEECLPGTAELALTLPVSAAALPHPDWTDRFEALRLEMPISEAGWDITAQHNAGEYVFDITPPSWLEDTLTEVRFFPYDKGLITNAAEQTLARTETGYRLTVQADRNLVDSPATLTGLLVTSDGWRGPNSESALAIDLPLGDAPAKAVTASTDGPSGLWQALLFAFLGGLILNLMPCVLPVLSLKVLGFVKQANESRSKAIGHSLIFTLGVLVSFWALVAVLLILQSGGEQLGWGFQLQSPAFVVVLSGFMFLFGLNLLGVFEIGTSLTAVGNTSSTGTAGSFLNGVTATIVATPCTAPFMGSALGFSLSQPGWVSFLVFTFLALGMAAPYVALTLIPGLVKFIPKPGRWMETLKQVMGFLLLATIIWLAWVLAQQAGALALVALFGTLLLLGLAAWVLGRWGTFSAARGARLTAYAATFVIIVSALTVGIVGADMGVPSRSAAVTSDGLVWESYHPDRVDELRQSGAPVLIDFTAAWCLSCQVNERIAFSSDDVRRRLGEMGVTLLKADWTSRDETITHALASYGRNSVPLYVLYGRDHNPIILPQILTPGIVLDALKEIES